jgi:hypothetical protein
MFEDKASSDITTCISQPYPLNLRDLFWFALFLSSVIRHETVTLPLVRSGTGN